MIKLFTTMETAAVANGFKKILTRAAAAWGALKGDFDQLVMRHFATASGISVDETTMLQLPAVLCAVRALSETVASLPMHLYERSGTTTNLLNNHPLYSVVHDAPNPKNTPFEFFETAMNSMVFYGNFYAEIERNPRGEVVALWPLHAYNMRVEELRGGELLYHYHNKYGQYVLTENNILHIRGFFTGGLLGLALPRLGAESIGGGLAANDHAHRIFKQGMLPGGILKYPGRLTDETVQKLQDRLNAQAQGNGRAHGALILHDGMEWEANGISPADAQLLEGRQFNVLEMSRIFRVPPHLLYDLSRSTFNNIAQAGQEFLSFGIDPWLVRIEQQFKRSVLRDPSLSATFNRNALLRADTESRYKAYRDAVTGGWMSPNEVRALENLNPIKGGDVYLVPLNMTSIENVVESGKSDGRDGRNGQGNEERYVAGCPCDDEEERATRREIEYRAKAQTRLKTRDAWSGVFLREWSKVFRGMLHNIRELVDKHRGLREYTGVVEGLRDYFSTGNPKGFIEFLKKQLGPAYNDYARAISAATADEIGEDPPPDMNAFISSVLDEMAAAKAETKLGELLKILQDGGDLDALDARLAEWEATGAGTAARGEIIHVAEATARATLERMGVSKLRWYTVGKNCPHCNHIDGRVVGIDEPFVSKGEAIPGDDAHKSFTAQRNRKHPPLHKGCDCFIGVSV